jgi:hypothetical protein
MTAHLNPLLAAVRVATLACDLHGVLVVLTIGTAIFLAGHAITGRVSALFLVWHEFSFGRDRLSQIEMRLRAYMETLLGWLFSGAWQWSSFDSAGEGFYSEVVSQHSDIRD